MTGSLSGNKIRQRFEEQIIELLVTGILNLCGHLKDVVLRACDGMCETRVYKNLRRYTTVKL